jgi:hypothetical protein
MHEALWLIVAIVFGALAAYGWINRELWIHRRRERSRDRKDVTNTLVNNASCGSCVSFVSSNLRKAHLDSSRRAA